ncbi:MAG: HEAT repeat domain-containing protein [Bacteroidia bacterium]|nr:HEAT repeat domain-containing protein [Bacteroidia bacterium]
MKKINVLTEKLNSKNPEIILDAILKLRNKGTFQVIAQVVKLLNTTQDEEIKKAILNFLNDLKNKESIPEIVAAIKNPVYKKNLQPLISSCWQSGLDYSNYLAVFTDIVIRENYAAAFEAFTVIENMYGIISKKEIDINIKKLKSAINIKNKEKSYLYVELVKVLSAKQGD